MIHDLDYLRSHSWVIPWSGGKDSTATIICALEFGIPISSIDYVRMMFDDYTPATLPIMTDFVDTCISTFRSIGLSVNVHKSPPFMSLANKRYFRSKKHPDRNGHYYGVTPLVRGHCSFQQFKELSLDCPQLLGYTVDETPRLARLTDTKQSLLATLNLTQSDARLICSDYGMLSPLYDLGFTRDGCWFCPNASLKSRQYLYENHPYLASRVYELIDMCGYDVSCLASRNNWIGDYYDSEL